MDALCTCVYGVPDLDGSVALLEQKLLVQGNGAMIRAIACVLEGQGIFANTTARAGDLERIALLHLFEEVLT